MTDTQRVRLAWLIPILMALASLALSGLVAYSHERESDRIGAAVTANQQQNDHERLERLEQKVDRVLEELRRR